ncbi:MAG: sirohydrochlorin cobaltochelatase [Victivallaceae bacterium]|nr:sirohydrochlorin cobaltochelatase [Victivallaceae bacterium]
MFNKLTLLKKSLFLSAASALTCSATVAAASTTPDKVIKQPSKQAILLVAFGTSQPGAKKAFENIEKVVSKRFSETTLRWAYTSAFIRKKLKKQGTVTYSVTEALEQLRQSGVTKVAVQSLHISLGAEFLEIITAVERFRCRPDTFEKITIGMPLLNSQTDIDKFYQALTKVIPAERKSTAGVVLLGHGNGHSGIGDMTYIATDYKLKQKDKNIYVGTVEGKPNFEDVKQRLIANKIKTIYMLPLMVVAGDHANNDMAGPEADSWKSLLTKQGIKCYPILKGLGENDAIAEIFADHLQAALTALNETKH